MLRNIIFGSNNATQARTPAPHQDGGENPSPAADGGPPASAAEQDSTEQRDAIAPDDDDAISISTASVEVLRVGDIIRYHTRLPLAGSGVLTKVVTAVRPRPGPNESILIVWPDHEFIEEDTTIQRIRTLSSNGEYVDVDVTKGEGKGRPLDTFELEEGGTGTASDSIMQHSSQLGAVMAKQREKLRALGVPTDLLLHMKGGDNASKQRGSAAENAPSVDDAGAKEEVGATEDATSSMDSADCENYLVEEAHKRDGKILPPKTTCTVNHCKGKYEKLLTCSGREPGGAECKRAVHESCWRSTVFKLNGRAKNVDDYITVTQGTVQCTKDHYVRWRKWISDTDFGWDNDGPKGRDDPEHSESTLAKWLILGGGSKYRRFRGPPRGMTKLQVGAEIAAFIKANGCKKEHTAQQCVDKVQWFEKHMRPCYRWASNTGVGVLENEGPTNFHDALKQMFKYFHDLDPIFRDFSSQVPRLTTDVLDALRKRNGGGGRVDGGARGVAVAVAGGATGGTEETTENAAELVARGRVPEEPAYYAHSTRSKRGAMAETSNAQPPKRVKLGAVVKGRSGGGGEGDGKKQHVPGRSGAQLILQLLKKKLEHCEEKKDSPALPDGMKDMVALSKQFGDMVSNLERGGDKMPRVTAAKLFPDFSVFLSSEEKRQL